MVTGGDAQEPRHPMRYVTRQTGLSEARVRSWERRYGAVAPGRSAGGQRLYSDDDIARLGLIARAAEAGHALPQLASLSREALTRLLARDRPDVPVVEAPRGEAVDRLLALVEQLDGASLEAELRRLAMDGGIVALSEGVLAPLLTAIGERWHTGTLGPAQEHLGSAAVFRVLNWVGAQFTAPVGAPTLVVATPQGEEHELGAAMAAAVAGEMGWRVVYLGRDLPAEDIAAAAHRTRAQAVALSVVNRAATEALASEVARVVAALGDEVRVAVGGGAAASLAGATGDGATVCRDMGAFRAFLKEVPRDPK